MHSYPNVSGVVTRWLEIPYGNGAIRIRFIPEPFLVDKKEYILILAVLTDSGEHDIKKLGKSLYKYMRRVYKSTALFLHKDSYIKIFKSLHKGVVPMAGLSLNSKVYNIPIEWGLGDEVKAYDVF